MSFIGDIIFKTITVGDIKYDFYKNKDYEKTGQIYCSWNGKYTNGTITYRGTRLYFNNATLLQLGYVEFSVIPPNEEGDDCCIRNESLQKIVNNMTNIDKDWDFIEIKNKDDISLLYTQLLDINEFNKNYEYICCTLPIDTLFFINEKDLILHELREVVKICNENNVIWEWI